jgi:hypothetical protein
MKDMVLKYCFWLLFAGIPFFASGQWGNGQVSVFFSLPEVALVDIESAGDNQIHFSILPSSESGQPPELSKIPDETLWINYSSALSRNQDSRAVTAEISQGNVPEGLRLFLEAGRYLGNGRGSLGQPAGKTELTNSPRPIVTGIGNCYTGDGVNNGHQLSFSIEIADYEKLKADDQIYFEVLYTLTDN